MKVRFGQTFLKMMILSTSRKGCAPVRKKFYLFRKLVIGQKREMVIKIEFTPSLALRSLPDCTFFKNPFLRETFCRLESERGVNSILITILRFRPTSWKDRTYCLVASFSACRKDHFRKIVQNGPSLQILYNWAHKYLNIYFWQKNGRLFVCFVLLQYFVWFWLTFF